jgi:AcrR family transcriptional regulator
MEKSDSAARNQNRTGQDETLRARKTREKRALIIEKAIDLYASKGFTRTRISDITNSSHIGKGTFYLYFKDKLELFYACMDTVARRIQSEDFWPPVTDETSIDKILYQRAEAFQKAFPQLSGILIILRRALRIDDPQYVIMTRDYLRRLVSPMVKDLRKSLESAGLRDINVNATAYLLLSVFETVGYTLMLDPHLAFDKAIEPYLDIIKHGIMAPEEKEPKMGRRNAIRGVITDSGGTTTHITDIRFGGEDYLTAKLGKSEVRIDPRRVASIELKEKGPLATALLNMKDQEQLTVKIGGNVSCTGNAALGELTIPMKEVSKIIIES